MGDLRLESLPIAALKPYERNARTHSRKQIKQIAASIERFGFNAPVLIDEENGIIAGHGRVEAAKLLKLQAVPTIRLSHLTETEKRAYILADNKLALNAGWNREMLAIEVRHLFEVGFDPEPIGFETPELDQIVDEAEARDNDPAPEDVVELPLRGPAVSGPGDLWCLGKHRLYCGDARAPESYAALLGEEKAGIVFTDPPYNVRIEGNVGGLGKVKHADFAMAAGEMSEADFTAFLKTVFGRLVAASVDGSIHYICIDWRHIGEMLAASRGVYAELKNLCVWRKTVGGMGTFYRSKHELVFVFKNGAAPHINNFELGQHGRTRTNVWDYAGVVGFKAGRLEEIAMHPTVKPVAMIADALRDTSKRGGLVLDPFGGSGSTLIAAEKTGRRARLIELDPTYVDVIIRRFEAYAGKPATLEKSGETFELIAERRAKPPRAA
jgi:DNA modification methylase